MRERDEANLDHKTSRRLHLAKIDRSGIGTEGRTWGATMHSLPPAFAGFDTDAYPGDAHMKIWKAASPYVFTGYYLHAPCHGDRGWMGHRATLVAQGWHVVPIYVGQQTAGVSPCKSAALSAQQGRADAKECAIIVAAQGFAKASFVYLDIERCDVFSGGLRDYLAAWTAELAAAGFGPGVYCHKYNAPDVRATALGALASYPQVQPRFWIVGGATADFDAPASRPSGSGIAFADLWQRPVSIQRTFGGITIDIDEDLSNLDDPGAPSLTPALT
jgi:hypothetical protein